VQNTDPKKKLGKMLKSKKGGTQGKAIKVSTKRDGSEGKVLKKYYANK